MMVVPIGTTLNYKETGATSPKIDEIDLNMEEL